MVSAVVRASREPHLRDLVTLTDDRGASSATIAPARGAIVTSFAVGGRELLYLDESTLLDPSKNVRGGIPILFPSPGKLDGDVWRRGTAGGSMKQHGFARNLPWEIASVASDAPRVTLRLAPNDATRVSYPWDFRVEFVVALEGPSLKMGFTVSNAGSLPMPYALGFHPYFRVTDKARARIDTRATKAFDNVSKKVAPFAGFDLTEQEVDLHLLDHGSAESALHFGDGAALAVRCSAEFSRWVVWTLAGKDFVCLEPWTAPGNALNTGEGLITLAPGEVKTSSVDWTFAP